MQPTSHAATELERRFDAALTGATATAALSPSSHNCQPWGLARLSTDAARAAAATLLGGGEERTDEEYVALALDHGRELTALPAHAVEMRVSCGAYWRTLLRALAAQGWAPSRVRVLEADARAPFSGWPPRWSLLCVAALRYGEGSGERFAELRTTAGARRTQRGAYRREPLDAGLLDGLETPTVEELWPGTVTVQHLTRPQQLEAFAAFCSRYAGRDFSHPEAWRETHSYLRLSRAEADMRGDGFTLRQLFGPLTPARHLAKRVLLDPRVLRPLCRLGFDRRLADGLAATVRAGTPALTTMGFTTAQPGPADLLAGGARLADYWLAAAGAGLALHPVSVVVQHEDLRQKLQARLGLAGRTFFVSRLGRPTAAVPPTARRPDAGEHRSL
ncbi:RedV protein [Streptomyces sp. B15]|uniref:RedV protein n=1 Tax=Streptomyces sp. B15 TaxID=1537797 RepID=UPI001B37813C|nr:RedV protein [Streptomyces sp. B15]MBQ1120139.1 RedV protein [Streptomyces sp. B15]